MDEAAAQRSASGAPDDRIGERQWWETRPFVAFLILVSMVPLLYPPVPPLVDLLGHMGRYRVQLDIGESEWLARYYTFHWQAIGNLGVDLLIIPLSKLFGLEVAVKLVVLAIPPMTVAGFLWVAREVHHRLPPTVLFALPFVYSHPFLYGFVNYALSIALAFLAFGLWLRLGRLGRLRLRAILFVPISIIVFFAHTYGWGVLGLLCFSAEAVRQHDQGRRWLKSGVAAAAHASVMLLPLVIMAVWRSGTQGGDTAIWFQWQLKFQFLIMALRDRWKAWDVFAICLALIVIIEARRQKDLTFSRNLAFSSLVLLAGFLALPYIIFSSAYADMRLIPYVVAVGVLGIRFRETATPSKAQLFAVVGLGFYLLRLAGTTASLAIAAQDQSAKLEALDHVPVGARVAYLVNDGCGNDWALPRNRHLGAMVIVRREGFANDQWVLEGMNLLGLRYHEAGPFASDPSQQVRPAHCLGAPAWDVDQALRALPRSAFDYVWMVDPLNADHGLMSDFQPVWRGVDSVLYRIKLAGAARPAVTLRRERESVRSGVPPARRPVEVFR